MPDFIAKYAKAWVATVIAAAAATIEAEGPSVKAAVVAALTFFATYLVRNRPDAA